MLLLFIPDEDEFMCLPLILECDFLDMPERWLCIEPDELPIEPDELGELLMLPDVPAVLPAEPEVCAVAAPAIANAAIPANAIFNMMSVPEAPRLCVRMV